MPTCADSSERVSRAEELLSRLLSQRAACHRKRCRGSPSAAQVEGSRHRRARWTFHSGQRRVHAHEPRSYTRLSGEARDRLWRSGSRPPISPRSGTAPGRTPAKHVKLLYGPGIASPRLARVRVIVHMVGLYNILTDTSPPRARPGPPRPSSASGGPPAAARCGGVTNPTAEHRDAVGRSEVQ